MNPNDPRTDRFEGELDEIYAEQIIMLKARCDSFYEGKVYEAKSAAAILYILLMDKGKSQKSLLGQLKKKQKIKFLDSRERNELTCNSARGAWPRTVWPFKQFRKENLCDFKEWWTGQPFKLVFNDIQFTRQEIVESIRHQEGGGHVDSLTSKKIAAIRRSRSGWQRLIKENEDGTTSMYVGIDFSRKPLSQDSDYKEISDHELACICAIAEEVLFSITPEPENRLRMHIKEYKKPFYLTKNESDECKEHIRKNIQKLDSLKNLDNWQERIVTKLIKSMQKELEIESFTSENCNRKNDFEYILKRSGVDWPI